MFHVSKSRPHTANDDQLFPKRDVKFYYNFGAPDPNEWLADEIVGHRWIGNRVEFEVRWLNGLTSWEPVKRVSDTSQYRAYLELKAVTDWRRLARKAPAEVPKQAVDVAHVQQNIPNMSDQVRSEPGVAEASHLAVRLKTMTRA